MEERLQFDPVLLEAAGILFFLFHAPEGHVAQNAPAQGAVLVEREIDAGGGAQQVENVQEALPFRDIRPIGGSAGHSSVISAAMRIGGSTRSTHPAEIALRGMASNLPDRPSSGRTRRSACEGAHGALGEAEARSGQPQTTFGAIT